MTRFGAVVFINVINYANFGKKTGGKIENCEDLKAKNLQRPLIELKMYQSVVLMSTFHTHFFREIRGLEQKITR